MSTKVDQLIAMYTGVRGDDRQRELLINELLGLLSYVRDLEAAAGNDESEWEKVFDAIFEGGICKRVNSIASKLGRYFDYYDPDTTYQEDAQGFIRGLEDYVRPLI